MSAKAERPRNGWVKLVGGGRRKVRERNPKSSKGGSMKAQRRATRKAVKANKKRQK